MTSPKPTPTVADLLAEIGAACGRMGTKNPHRWLFARCAAAVKQLAEEVVRLREGRDANGERA